MRFGDFLEDIGGYVSFHPNMTKLCGSTNANIFLSNLISWTGKERSADGWIYKNSDEIEEETGLSYKEQATARKHLSARGFLEENNRRFEHKIYFRVDKDAISSAWESKKPDFAKVPMGISGKSQRAFRETTDGDFDPINTSLTTSLTSSRQQKSVDPNIEKIISVYNETAVLMKWIPFKASSRAKRINAVIKNRSEDPVWMADLERYARGMQKHDWTEGWDIENFLRPLNMKKCFNGAWSDKTATNFAPKPQEQLDLSKPWNVRKEPANAS